MAEKVTLEKVNEKLKEGVKEFNKQSNIGKVVLAAAVLVILGLLLSYSTTLFFFGGGVWLLYCWGKKLMTPTVVEKHIF